MDGICPAVDLVAARLRRLRAQPGHLDRAGQRVVEGAGLVVKPARPALIPTTSRHEIEQLPSIRSGPLHGAESRIASIAARTPCATLGRGTICWIGVIVPTYSSGDSGD